MRSVCAPVWLGAVRHMRLLTKIILTSVAALAVVVSVIAGIGLYVINDATLRSDLKVLRSELNAVVLDLKDDNRSLNEPMTDQRAVSELRDFENSTGYSYFAVRPDGRRLFTLPDAQNEFSDATFRGMLEAGNGSGWLESPTSRYLVQYALLSDPDILIGVRMTEEQVFADRATYLTAIATAALLILLAGSGFAILHGRALTRRIGTTLSALDRINEGEFGIRISGADASDELSAIQRRINDLADSFARRATEREAEQRIRESEEQFRLLSSTSPVGIFVADPEGNCEYVNEAYEEMSGRSLAHSTGKGWLEAVHPEDRARLQSEWEQSVGGDMPYRTEFRYLRSDGSVAWAIAQAVAQHDALGRPVRFIGAVTNVTDRVEAEVARQESDERFRLLTTLSPVGVFMTDAKGRLEYVNDSLAEMLGMPAEITYGNGWIEGIHPDDRAALLDVWKSTFRHRQTLEIEFRMGDGTDEGRWVLVQASPLSGTGEPGGYIGAVTDITDRRLAEEQLRQVQKMDAVGQLTGGIAHDFNNLLAIVQGNLELLRERAPEEDRILNLVEAAYGAAQRGAALNQRLLAFARRQPLRPSVCDINDIVGDMAGLFERTLGDNIELRTQFAEGLWTTDIDPNGLETAVLNLAINARDAMPDGGTLIIATSNRSYDDGHPAPDPDLPPGAYVALKVSDTGTGMDPETLEKAFDPFYTTKGMGKGSGLGLSMVYGFARQSKGTAIVESVPGAGTSITLLFPRELGETDADTAPRLPPSRRAAVARAGPTALSDRTPPRTTPSFRVPRDTSALFRSYPCRSRRKQRSPPSRP